MSRLRLKWKFFAGKDISATPAVDSGVVYFPSWNGYLYAVNAFTGASIWKQNLSELTGLNGTGIVVNVTVSRSTPTTVNDLLIVGIYGPAVVIALNRSDGKLVWSTQLDPRPRVLITMYGIAFLGLVILHILSFFWLSLHIDGKLVWSTKLDPRPRVLITMSGTAFLGLVILHILSFFLVKSSYTLQYC